MQATPKPVVAKPRTSRSHAQLQIQKKLCTVQYFLVNYLRITLINPQMRMSQFLVSACKLSHKLGFAMKDRLTRRMRSLCRQSFTPAVGHSENAGGKAARKFMPIHGDWAGCHTGIGQLAASAAVRLHSFHSVRRIKGSPTMLYEAFWLQDAAWSKTLQSTAFTEANLNIGEFCCPSVPQ